MLKNNNAELSGKRIRNKTIPLRAHVSVFKGSFFSLSWKVRLTDLNVALLVFSIDGILCNKREKKNR